jgi:hypothetical protein
MAEKGVHFFGLCRLIRKESFPVGIAARNVNFEDHYTCFGSECLCMHVLF